MKTVLWILGIALIYMTTYFLINIGRLLAVWDKNKNLYLKALLNLSNRVAYVARNIPDKDIEMEMKFSSTIDLLKNRESKTLLTVKLATVENIVSADFLKIKKSIIFPYDPVKLFYEKYKAILEDLPQLRKELEYGVQENES